MKTPTAAGNEASAPDVPPFYLVYYPPDFAGEEEARAHFESYWAKLLHDNPRAVEAAGGDENMRPEQAIPGGGAVFINGDWRLVGSMKPVDFTSYEIGAASPTGDGHKLVLCPECGKTAYYEHLPMPFPPHFYIHRLRIDDGESKDTAGCFAEAPPDGE